MGLMESVTLPPVLFCAISCYLGTGGHFELFVLPTDYGVSSDITAAILSGSACMPFRKKMNLPNFNFGLMKTALCYV